MTDHRGKRGAGAWLRLVSRCLGVAAGLVAASPGAQAHRRDFPFTYDWFQAARGEKEIELQSLYLAQDDTFQQQVEFEYGVTDRFMLAPYLVFERGDGEGWHYDAFKLESRYQLGTYQPGRILPGLYLEYEKPHDEAAEIEGKLILSRYNRDGGDLSLNLITERSLESSATSRYTYSFGYSRPLLNRFRLRGGGEWIRNLDDGRVNAGPVLGFAPASQTFVTAGYGFPVNHSGENGGEIRLLLEYEWFYRQDSPGAHRSFKSRAPVGARHRLSIS